MMSHSSTLRMSENSSLSLYNIHTSLLKMWTENQVDELYQRVFLTYLDSLSEPEGKKEIMREYQRMLDNRSHYNKIRELNNFREETLQQIHTYGHHDANIEYICAKIDALRKTNLQLVEEILSLSSYFKNKQLIGIGYNKLFMKMNEDNQKLKDTIMAEYIIFSAGFDPFFLHHYELSQKSILNMKKSKAVEKLFNMNISYVFRLIKAKNQMLNSLSKPVPEANGVDLTPANIQQFQPQIQPILFQEKGRKRQNYKRNSQPETNSKQDLSKRSRTYQSKIKSQSETLEKYKFGKLPAISQKMGKRDLGKKQRNDEKIRKLKEKEEQELNEYRTRMLQSGRKNYSSDPYSFKKNPSTSRQSPQRKEKWHYESPVPKKIHTQMDSPLSKQRRQKSTQLKSPTKIKKYLVPLESVERMPTRNYKTNNQQVYLPMQSQSPQFVNKNKYKTIEGDEDEDEYLRVNSYSMHPKRYKRSKRRTITDTESSYQRSTFYDRQTDYVGKIIKNYDDKEEQMQNQKIQEKPEEQENESEEKVETIEVEKQKQKLQLEKKQEEQKKKQEEKKRELEKKMEKDENQHSSSFNQDQIPKKSSPEKSQLQFIKTTAVKYEINPEKQLKDQKKVLKMKPANLHISELFQYIQKMKIQKKYRKLFENGSWTQKFIHNQSYLTQFYFGSQMYAFSLTLPTLTGNYRIGYWAPLEGCNQKFNIFLFKKYLQYLEKITSLRYVYLAQWGIFENIKDFGFEPYQTTWRRKRYSLSHVQEHELKYFVSCQFTNICLKQSSKDPIFTSEQSEHFDEECKASPIGMALKVPLSLNQYINSYRNVESLEKVNILIEENGLDSLVSTSSSKADNIQLLCINWLSSFKRYFLLEKGFLIGQSFVNFRQDKQLICQIKLEKSQFRIFLGKGFENVRKFLQNISPSQEKQSLKIGVKCFLKQLFGKIQCQQKGMGCYGNWEMSYFWQDQLQGKIRHNLNQFQLFGPESFRVAVYSKEQMLYAFQVHPNNFIY